jgi:hypothetical protein
MTTEAPIFTPEVEVLLREIAAEPDSVLLRMPREKVKASLMETRSPVGPMTAGLSNAERELVRVHREEFAFQLRQAAWAKLAGDGVGPVVVSRQWQGNKQIPVPSSLEVRDGIRGSARCSGLPEESQYPLPNWVDSPIGQWPSIASIAAVAHRFAPKSQDLIYAGGDYLIRRSPHTALECFASALGYQSDAAIAGVIFMNIANCHDQMGTLLMSISNWKVAHHYDPERIDFVAFWFIVSLRAGQDLEVQAAERALTSLSHHSQQLEELIARVVARRQIGYWHSTEKLTAALARWSSRLSFGGSQLATSLC